MSVAKEQRCASLYWGWENCARYLHAAAQAASLRVRACVNAQESDSIHHFKNAGLNIFLWVRAKTSLSRHNARSVNSKLILVNSGCPSTTPLP